MIVPLQACLLLRSRDAEVSYAQSHWELDIRSLIASAVRLLPFTSHQCIVGRVAAPNSPVPGFPYRLITRPRPLPLTKSSTLAAGIELWASTSVVSTALWSGGMTRFS